MSDPQRPLHISEICSGHMEGIDEPFDESKILLRRYIWRRDWPKVERLCEANPKLLSGWVTSSKDTALHVAINDEEEDVVKRLSGMIEAHRVNQALKARNDIGETALHCAAARGSQQMCEMILHAAGGDDLALELLGIPNKWNQNPIFVAIVYNRKLAFNYLYNAAFSKAQGKINFNGCVISTDGDTILHWAIRSQHLDLALDIIQKCPWLSSCSNTAGIAPLGELARTPSLFRSCDNLSWWEKIIYFCIHVDPLKYDPNPTTGTETRTEAKIHKFDCPKNYLTCYFFLSFFGRILSRIMKRSNNSSSEEASGRISHLPGDVFRKIGRRKQDYIWSLQIMDQLLEKRYDEESMKQHESHDLELGFSEAFHPNIKKQFGDDVRDEAEKVISIANRALLAAAESGVIEVVDKILRRFPKIIPEDTCGSSEWNIMMVAVQYQHVKIFEALRKHLTKISGGRKPNVWHNLLHAEDKKDNTILHIAAKYDESLSQAWQAYGYAMQMQCEVAWFEYVKSLVPNHFLFLKNSEGNTPVQIFTKDHKDLLTKGSEWIKDTASSCSVVAGLVAGTSYATATTVPGGTDNSGKPTLQGHPAFKLFVTNGIIGIGFSVTALIMFLAILTSPKQPKDFKSNLPFKLLLGLSSLFVSIASLFVSFCGSDFFVLQYEFKKEIFPLYAVICLPIAFYAIAQFPLYMDLMKAIVKRAPRSQKYREL